MSPSSRVADEIHPAGLPETRDVATVNLANLLPED
ncbi:hypothetical protein J2R71_000119 [Bradyrhizobium japonicum]|nr:hypothetical protein [Bradyrhizobium japonicum]MCP1876963.1 hypothetical protein [Bradyrhizobium japonicum]MCP1954290.1 hypothetical protein [Bradyrhizobium japonicum]MCS3911956.1 hypothetical protein [Bradyrhizobium japonicum]